ncbi:unnamed protein product [Dracunculus medinensis]|uniref:Fimbrial protein n=1 Tax=Dracunculus medinensis TaxID=318479 RepID=A0A0N4UCF4_DRAME|nr:unnamed protein product [Dracunculus medinensis]
MNVTGQVITIHSLSKYRFNIACLSEVRLPHFGSRAIINPGSDQRYWLYQCDASDNAGQNGVAIVISDKAHSAFIEWKPVNDRMAYALLKGNLCNISVINVYAPTLSADDRDKNKFCGTINISTNNY